MLRQESRSKSQMRNVSLSKRALSIITPQDRKTSRRTLSRMSLAMVPSRLLFYTRGNQFKIPRYQNTYRLEPFRKFHAETVDTIVRNIMENKLANVNSYNADHIAKLSKEITQDVVKAVIRKDYDRCKIVVQVTIIQRLRQSVHAAFQCLWDTERDNHSYHVFQNHYIYASCCVFGLYYE